MSLDTSRAYDDALAAERLRAGGRQLVFRVLGLLMWLGVNSYYAAAHHSPSARTAEPWIAAMAGAAVALWAAARPAPRLGRDAWALALAFDAPGGFLILP